VRGGKAAAHAEAEHRNAAQLIGHWAGIQQAHHFVVEARLLGIVPESLEQGGKVPFGAADVEARDYVTDSAHGGCGVIYWERKYRNNLLPKRIRQELRRVKPGRESRELYFPLAR
jgi:hypothetical protein